MPRDEAFRAQVVALCDLYTRPLGAHERVLSVDEKTSLQPRTRTSPTRPALPGGGTPVQLEHEYQRKGALNLLAAFDTRTGDVIGICRRRKRQLEFIELLEAIERATPPSTSGDSPRLRQRPHAQGQARVRLSSETAPPAGHDPADGNAQTRQKSSAQAAAARGVDRWSNAP